MPDRSRPPLPIPAGTGHPSGGHGLSAVSAPLSLAAALLPPETERPREARLAPRSALQVQRRFIQPCAFRALQRCRQCSGSSAAAAAQRGRGQVRTPPDAGHEVALSARGCRRLQELSKVKVTNRLFPPQGQGFGPSPSCHRHAAPPHLPAEASAGWAACPHPRGRPPASISRRGLRRCCRIILLFHPPSPSAAAKPLFNITETFIV